MAHVTNVLPFSLCDFYHLKAVLKRSVQKDIITSDPQDIIFITKITTR